MSSSDPCSDSGGILRPARRPRGWQAPGPPAPPPPGDPAVWPHAGEDLCYLSGDWRILQRLDGHRWSLDDLVTAWFAARHSDADAPRAIADLGCGIGAVLMMMAWRFPAARLVGIEAQPVSVDLAQRSLVWNGITDRCAVRSGDFRDPAILPPRGTFDLVTGTPPYLPVGTATESSRVQFGPCHFEHRGGIEDYCTAAVHLLRASGRFVMCAGGTQHARVEAAATAAGLTITRRRDVVPRAGKGTLFRVYQFRLGALPASHIDPPLIVRDATGRRTADLAALRADMGMPP